MNMLKPFSVVLSLATISVLTVDISGAIAQSTALEIAQAETATSLFVKPKYGVNFTTGPGSGYESSYGSFYGWFPFAQNGTSQLLFTEAKAIVDTDSGNWGGNFALGYRNFAGKNIFGGYVGYDVRGLEDWTSHQIGIGFEALNPAWEARLNGYIPVGDRSETIRNASAGSGTTTETTVNTTVSDPTFRGNNLVVTTDTTTTMTTTTRTIRELIVEEALGGFELEAGAKLTSWQNGFLKGFLGSYLYSGDRTETFLGLRGRLEAKLSNLNLGLGLETDGEFGTNLIFSIGATFGRNTSHADNAKIDNLTSSLKRQSNIALNQVREFTDQTETSVSTNTTTSDPIFLNNPATSQPWFFSHVNLDSATNGGGTEENPHNLIASALGAVPTNGNGIVYVQGTNASSVGFTIPANVRVISNAPLLSQVLDSVPKLPSIDVTSSVLTGNVTLPRAGTGDRPVLTSDVSFSDSGGELNGFEFNNGSRVTFMDIGGEVTIANSIINDSDGDAIEGNISNGATTQINILNNQIDSPTISAMSMLIPSADGIDIEVSGNSTVNLLVDGNEISGTQNSGIELETNPDQMSPNSVLNSTITNNTINNSGGDGILFLHNSDVAMAMTINNNVIDTAGTAGNGITRTIAPVDLSSVNPALTTLNAAIAIGDGGGFGVGVITLSDGELDLEIANNQITDTQDAKIGVAANPAFLYTADTVVLPTVINVMGVPFTVPPEATTAAVASIQAQTSGASNIQALISGNNLSGSGEGLKDLTLMMTDYSRGNIAVLTDTSGSVCVTASSNTFTPSPATEDFLLVENGGSTLEVEGINLAGNAVVGGVSQTTCP